MRTQQNHSFLSVNLLNWHNQPVGVGREQASPVTYSAPVLLAFVGVLGGMEGRREGRREGWKEGGRDGGWGG